MDRRKLALQLAAVATIPALVLGAGAFVLGCFVFSHTSAQRAEAAEYALDGAKVACVELLKTPPKDKPELVALCRRVVKT